MTRQKYDEAKQELQALLARKKQVDTNLASSPLPLDDVSTWLLNIYKIYRSTWSTPSIYLKDLIWKTHNKMEISYVDLMVT